MNLELLRKLATVDPELFLPDDMPDWFQLPEQGYAFTRRGELKFREFFEYHLFFALLDRIQARGWKLFLIVKPEGRFATIYPSSEAGYKALGEAIESSPCEALAHAYVQACKENQNL